MKNKTFIQILVLIVLGYILTLTLTSKYHFMLIDNTYILRCNQTNGNVDLWNGGAGWVKIPRETKQHREAREAEEKEYQNKQKSEIKEIMKNEKESWPEETKQN